ncbi:hypothetical protein BDN71DRAFT_1514088 [Pleurotus eryngii]|uniref:Uncharacterized protein n=1 Tax=Pleurotus eryngii TaxID=5323 RepID=A0A9P5ZHR8_PLEER|nr:hypothetical protein BDN71DRAFT_1514088 [Pleurotus eryngii]
MSNAPAGSFNPIRLSAPQASTSATTGFDAPLPFNTRGTIATTPTSLAFNTSAPFAHLPPAANLATISATPTLPALNASAPLANANHALAANVDTNAIETPAANADIPTSTTHTATADSPTITTLTTANNMATPNAHTSAANTPVANTPTANTAAAIDSGSNNQVAGPLQPQRHKQTRDEVNPNMIISGKHIKKCKT